MNDDTLLLRAIPAQWVTADGTIYPEGFRPNRTDDGKPSFQNGDHVTPVEAWEIRNAAIQSRSPGNPAPGPVVGVT